MLRRILFAGGLSALTLLIMWGSRQQQPAEASEVQVVYQVGTAKAEITPTDWESRIYWMAGYGVGRAATSIHDPLMTRVVVIDDGSTPMAIVTYDLLGLTSDDADFIQGIITAQLPQLADHILIHATHQTLPPLQFTTREFFLPVENRALLLGQALNRIPKQMYRQFQIPPQEWRRTNPLTKYTNTETNFIRIGPAAILTVGGELYPELLVGGIEPVGIPPFNEFPPEPALVSNPGFAPYNFQFFFGLTNDFMGYIIPMSEWDGWSGGQYGEDFALAHDEGVILSSNLHLLMLGYETGEYPAQTPLFLPATLPYDSNQEAMRQ